MVGFDTYFIYKAGIIESLSTLEEGLPKLDSKPGGYLWLDYYAPSKDNLTLLIEPFGIHYLSLEDCLDDNQIPKINEYETYVHILFNTFLSIIEEDLGIRHIAKTLNLLNMITKISEEACHGNRRRNC